MLKDKLLAEAATKLDGAPIVLDNIFESVELPTETKEQFSTVFEQAVRAGAVKLAESHINEIAASAEAQINEAVEQKSVEIHQSLYESTDKFLNQVVKEWLAEHQVSVDSNIKASLFESLLTGLKTTLVEHNVSIPEDQVNVVEELQNEIAEQATEIANQFNTIVGLNESVDAMKREKILNESTAGLADTQREKVLTLVEGLNYSDSFGTKVHAIVEMVTQAKVDSSEQLHESEDPAAAAVDFVPEQLSEKEDKQTTVKPTVSPEMARMMAYMNR